MRLHTICLTFILIAFSISVFGNKLRNKDCKERVIDAYEQLSKIASEQEKKRFYIDYTISLKQTNSTEIESYNCSVALQGNKSLVKAGQVSVFQDDLVNVSVFHLKKSIYITDRVSEKDKLSQLSGIITLKDTVLETSTVKSCRSFENNTEIVLKVNSEFQRATNVNEIKFLLNDPANRIEEVELAYAIGHKIEFLKLKVNEIDVDFQLSPFKGDALSQIYSINQSLLSQYQDFKIIDVRPQTN